MHASGADAWTAAGKDGTGVTVAVIDSGFGHAASDYTNELAAGHLPANTTLVNEDCTNDAGQSTPYDGTSHGLATSEIVHQHAPGARLLLYCVNSLPGLSAAATALRAAGAKIVSMSLEWTLDARGDGTGPAGSAAAIVAQTLKAGVLWVNSAGNDIPQHWGATVADANRDKILDLGNADPNKFPYESNFYVLSGTTDGSQVWAYLDMQWDQWPTSSSDLGLYAFGAQCTEPFGYGGWDDCQAEPINPDGNGQPRPIVVRHTAGRAPTVELSTRSFANTSYYDQVWELRVSLGTTPPPAVRYDITGFGGFDGASALSCPSADADGNCVWAANAVNGSTPSPANSPYAFAVGAANVGADGSTPNVIEGYSSRGNTIDARIKPDIIGWDGLSSYVYPFSTDGFYGTSAAAPGVAGEAADALTANPALDAAQVQYFLEQRANNGAPLNPPTNQSGHGLATMGAVPASPGAMLPPRTKYQALPGPIQVLDTRTGLGGYTGFLTAGRTVTVAMPVAIPASATAVVVDVAGTQTQGSTYLSVYAGGIPWPGTSTVNLSTADATATVLAVVTLGANKTVTVYNRTAPTKAVMAVVGYYAPQGTGGYVPLATPQGILDTRTALGGHQGKIPAGGSALVAAGLPADAVAALVNVTSTNTTASGYLSATSTCDRSTGVVNYTVYTRAGAAIVPLDSAGRICISASGSAADVVVALVGYITNSGGASFVALPASVLVVDTSNGNGGHYAPIPGGQTFAYQGGGLFGVPYAATALLANVVGANATATTWETAFPGAQNTGTTSTLNLTVGRVVSNSAFLGLHQPDGVYGISNHAGTIRAVLSISGYFV